MGFFKNIFDVQNCSICGNPNPVISMKSKEQHYICRECKIRFDELNGIHTYCDLFKESSFEKIYKSIKKNCDIYSIKKVEREELITNTYQRMYSKLKYVNLELSSSPTPKKYLKDVVNLNISFVTSRTTNLKLDNFIVIDTETTGLKSSVNELLEIAAIKFVDGIPTECLTTLLKPRKEIPQETININHITSKMVEDAPDVSFVMESFNRFIDNYNIVGYNTEFDVQFLHNNGLDFFSQKRYFFDALPICKKYYEEIILPNFKLDTVCNQYGIERYASHRAVEDALATGIIFNDLGHKIKNGEKYYIER